MEGSMKMSEKKFFSCDKCPHTVYFTSSLKQEFHMKTVHGEVDLSINCSENITVEKTSPLPSSTIMNPRVLELVNCDLCMKKFDSIETLRIHQNDCVALSNKLMDSLHKCMVCFVTFETYDILVEHHREKHMEEKCFKCKYCEASFSWQENLERHTKIHQNTHNSDREEKPLSCQVCSNHFHSIVSLSSHMSLMHPEHPFTCDGTWGLKDIDKIVSQKKARNSSITSNSIKLVDVNQEEDLSELVSELANNASGKRKAGVEFDEPPASRFKQSEDTIIDAVIIEEEDDIGVQRLVNAVAAQNDPNSLYCHTCDKTYKGDARSATNLSCEHCGWTFTKTNQLEAHIEHLHAHDILQSICRVCNAQFKNNTAMDRHYAQNHPESRMFHCYQCDNQFNTKACLRGHMQRHQPRRSHSSLNAGKHICPHCNMGYTHAHQLLTHITKSHQAFVPKPGVIGDLNTKFVCGFCTKVFSYEGSLKVHLKQHEEKIKAKVLRISDVTS